MQYIVHEMPAARAACCLCFDIKSPLRKKIDVASKEIHHLDYNYCSSGGLDAFRLFFFKHWFRDDIIIN